MNKIQEYMSLLNQLSLFFIILYSIIILQNNLNILFLETNPILIILGMVILYYLFKRIVEFFGLDLTEIDVFSFYLLILLVFYLDDFSFLLSNLYFIAGFFIIFELYYLLAKTLPIDYQLIQLEFFPKEVYRSPDNLIVIREKGLLFKTLIGEYSQQITSLPKGRLDDLYKLLIVNKGTISEVNDVTYFQFSFQKIALALNSQNKVKKIKKDLENVQMFIKNTLRYCI